jgi:hypothetical protein
MKRHFIDHRPYGGCIHRAVDFKSNNTKNINQRTKNINQRTQKNKLKETKLNQRTQKYKSHKSPTINQRNSQKI